VKVKLKKLLTTKLVIAYLAANILHTNAQRSGIVEKMKVEECTNRHTTEDGNILIRALEYKTTSTGPANIVVTKEIEQLMYLHIFS